MKVVDALTGSNAVMNERKAKASGCSYWDYIISAKNDGERIIFYFQVSSEHSLHSVMGKVIDYNIDENIVIIDEESSGNISIVDLSKVLRICIMGHRR